MIIYVAEGCYHCHSQQIRPLFAETERYGQYSKPGEFIYDRPFQWGSRRIGPDLAREGGKQSHDWHFRHMMNPSAITPGSVMPAYPHLLRKLNLTTLPARVQAAASLGAPNDRELDEGIEMAHEQAKKIVAELILQQQSDKFEDLSGNSVSVKEIEESSMIALIAYLQRVGIDLTASPDEETSEESTSDDPNSQGNLR